MQTRTSAAILATFLTVPAAALAQGTVIARCIQPMPPCTVRECPRPRPMPCPDFRPGNPIERVRSDVRVEMVDRVLRYEVTEVFVNRGSGLGEADYVFPLPAGAAFQDLRLSINGELVSGETLGADEARRVYEEIVRTQRDPALVEWMGHGLLRARIFPLNPGEEKKVVVRFQSVASREGDALRVDYFRGSAPNGQWRNAAEGRRGGDRVRGPSFTLLYPNDRQFGTAYSPTHDADVSRDGDRRRVELNGGGSAVTVLIPVRRGSAPAISVLTYAAGEDDRFALVTLSPPAMNTRRTPREVTLVMDISGSMSGRKMEQARQSARRLLETLSPGDRFRIVDFATDVRAFPRTWSDRSDRDVFASVTNESIREAQRYINDLDAAGSTNISGALAEALKAPIDNDRLSLVLFMTDGEATVGERRAEVIADSVRGWRRGRRLFSFGLGADLNVSLLEQIALEGRGTAQFVRPEEDVERAVALAAQRLSTPVVTDVRIRAEGVTLRQILPGDAVDLFAGNDLVFLARYRGDGDTRITITGRTADGPVTWTTAARFPERDRENRFVPRLWATRRVGYLSAERRRNGGSREVDDEIRMLGEKYGIPTEFSSYLVLEPGMVARRDNRALSGVVPTGVGNASGAGAAAPAAEQARRERAFDAAKSASVQRAAQSTAAADMMMDSASPSSARRVGGRTLLLKDGVWSDEKTSTSRVLRIKPMSDAWFALAREIPELRELLAAGDRVKVTGRAIVIEVTPEGSERLDAAELARAIRDWQ